MKLLFLLVTFNCILFTFQKFGFGVQKLRDSSYKKKLFLVAPDPKCQNVTTHWFRDAVIDNFAPISKQRKWIGKGQRYYLNKQFWGGNGYPIFVFIGGEGEERCTRLTNKSHLFVQAQQHRALLVDVEHRFYGESYPTPDMSTENLQYLSSEQALADLARIIGFIKSDLNTTESKVLTVGGSYPGNLAAWFRLKYPSVTQGSIASSAPLLAKTDFYEYMEVVGEALRYFGGDKCFDMMTEASHFIAELLNSGPGLTWKQIEKDFELCSPLESTNDVSILLSNLMGYIQGTVQYNNEHQGVLNVTDICKIMGTDLREAYENFIILAEVYRNVSNITCENTRWNDSISFLSDVKMDPANNARPWTYQTCNEFGYFQTTNSRNQPFFHWTPWLNLTFYMDICREAFNGWTSLPMVIKILN